MDDPHRTDRFEVLGGCAGSRPAARDLVASLRGVLAPERLDDAELAIHECLVNAAEHGHLGDPALPIVVEVAGPAHGAVTVTLTDRALGGSWHPDARATDRRGVRGRGLVLARAGSDGLTVRSRPGATTVTLHWSVDGTPAPSGPGPANERR